LAEIGLEDDPLKTCGVVRGIAEGEVGKINELFQWLTIRRNPGLKAGVGLSVGADVYDPILRDPRARRICKAIRIRAISAVVLTVVVALLHQHRRNTVIGVQRWRTAGRVPRRDVGLIGVLLYELVARATGTRNRTVHNKHLPALAARRRPIIIEHLGHGQL